MDNKFLKDVPSDVMFVWSIQKLNMPVGIDVYKRCEEIINANPKYFPWEHKYKSIPKEVHDSFNRECYPKNDTDELMFSSNGTQYDGILSQINNARKEPEVVKKSFVELFESITKGYEQQQKIKIEEEERVKLIWDKYYKKYGLKYR